LHTDTGKEWGLALVLLTAVSALFVAVRLLGHAFIVWEFELLVIYVPTTLCFVVFVLKRRTAFSFEEKGRKSHEATG